MPWMVRKTWTRRRRIRDRQQDAPPPGIVSWCNCPSGRKPASLCGEGRRQGSNCGDPGNQEKSRHQHPEIPQLGPSIPGSAGAIGVSRRKLLLRLMRFVEFRDPRLKIKERGFQRSESVDPRSESSRPRWASDSRVERCPNCCRDLARMTRR